MTALLTEHLPLVASAPNGVKKLRDLILELAVMGKLVPQDPNDEPASELLTRIDTEKAKVTSRTKVRKKDYGSQPEKTIESSFAIPISWQWTKLERLVVSMTNGLYKPEKFYTSDGVVSLRMYNIRAGQINFENLRRVEISSAEQNQYGLVAGDILVNRVNSAELVGKAAVIPSYNEPLVYESMNMRVRLVSNLVCSSYVNLVLMTNGVRASLNQVSKQAVGQASINQEQVSAVLIPLPPLAEQHRIVAKVDELMALCDRLDAEQSDAEAAHKQLVKALLDTLTLSIDQADFATSWERIKQNFDTIFTTESSVDALKQTLLQLAVMGKLVPPDPNDEPASELLEKIRQEKLVLVGKNKSAKESRWMPISNGKTPFVLPESWVWAKIEDYSSFTEYGISEKTFELTSGVPVIKMGDIQGGKVKLFGQKMVDSDCEVIFLKRHDVLYNRTNSAELVGKSGIFEGPDDTYTFASYLIRIQCLKGLSSPHFLNLAMNTPGFRETQINPHVKQQCGQANVNGTILKSMLIPVPPLAEQHRIVAKVDELVALCDSLKDSLGKALAHQELLSTVIVEHATNSDIQPALRREKALTV